MILKQGTMLPEHSVQEHLTALELFCEKVGMSMNASKAKVLVFSLKRKPNQVQINFNKR